MRNLIGRTRFQLLQLFSTVHNNFSILRYNHFATNHTAVSRRDLEVLCFFSLSDAIVDLVSVLAEFTVSSFLLRKTTPEVQVKG